LDLAQEYQYSFAQGATTLDTTPSNNQQQLISSVKSVIEAADSFLDAEGWIEAR
jgi:hypothetical protein